MFELPVRDACVDGVVNVFAPCAPAEFARVLKPGGKLIVAGAGEEHLMGLKRLLYDETHVNDSRRDLPGGGRAPTLSERRTVSFSMTVEGRENLDALFSHDALLLAYQPGRAGKTGGGGQTGDIGFFLISLCIRKPWMSKRSGTDHENVPVYPHV